MLTHDLTQFDIETLFRAFGLLGVAIYVTGFFCLCLGRIDSNGPVYFGMVFLASCCVLVSLSVDFNLAAAMIQCFYIAMSFGAIVLRLRKWRMQGYSGTPRRT